MDPRRLLLVPLLALSLGTSAHGEPYQRNRGPVDPMLRYGWLRELAGACWQGAYADGKAADLQCWSSQHGQFLRMTTKGRVPQGAKEVDVETDWVVAWDPVNGNMETFSWSSDGTWRRGDATLFQGAYRFWDRTSDGSTPVRRTIWRRVGPDAYEVSLERKEPDRWVDVRAVRYTRVRTTPPG